MKMFGILFLILTLLACSAHAFGVEDAQASDGDNPPLQLRVWYPEQAGKPGVFGTQLPLVLISHGAGGTINEHEDTAEALVDAGFVAVAVLHTGNNLHDQSGVKRGTQLIDRPRHISRAIDYMLTQWHATKQLDPNRIGVFGFSAGGFTALVVAGAEPDLSTTATHCRERPEAWDCRYLIKNGVDPLVKHPPRGIVWPHDARVHAIVAAAPAVGYAFDAESVRNVHVPVQLWGGDRDVIVEDSAKHIHDLLPATEYHNVANATHFSFMAPCSEALRRIINEQRKFGVEPICTDPEGFDRSAFHAEFNRSLIEFFRTQLR